MKEKRYSESTHHPANTPRIYLGLTGRRGLIWKFISVLQEHGPNVIWNYKRYVPSTASLTGSEGTNDNSSRYEGRRVSAIYSIHECFLLFCEKVRNDLSFFLCHMRDVVSNSTLLPMESEQMLDPFFNWGRTENSRNG